MCGYIDCIKETGSVACLERRARRERFQGGRRLRMSRRTFSEAIRTLFSNVDIGRQAGEGPDRAVSNLEE